jgi:hypothetical protein
MLLCLAVACCCTLSATALSLSPPPRPLAAAEVRVSGLLLLAPYGAGAEHRCQASRRRGPGAAIPAVCSAATQPANTTSLATVFHPRRAVWSATHRPPCQSCCALRRALATEHSPSSSSQIRLVSAQHSRPPEAGAAPSTAPYVIMLNGRRAPHRGQAYSVHLRPRRCILGLPPHRAHLAGISNHVGSCLMDPAPVTSSARPPTVVGTPLW